MYPSLSSHTFKKKTDITLQPYSLVASYQSTNRNIILQFGALFKKFVCHFFVVKNDKFKEANTDMFCSCLHHWKAIISVQ